MAMLGNLFKCCCTQQVKEAETGSPDSEEPELQSQGSISGGFRRGGGSRRGSTRSSTPSYTSDSAEVSDAPAVRPTEIVPTEESPVRAVAEPVVSKTKTKTKVKKTGHFWNSKTENTKSANGNNGSRNSSNKTGSSKSGNGKSERNQVEKNLSIRDRIKAFETSEDGTGEVKLREGQKPRKKKPTSKAFEEFETSGIIIGFGNAPKRRISEEMEEVVDPISQSESVELDAFPLPGLADDVQKQGLPKRTNSRLSTDDEGIHTMDSGEEDEFAAVTRNSELLKSFRRAPPPKNRTRARRSTRKRVQLQSDPFQDIPGLESPLEDSEYRWRSDDKSSYTSSRDNISEDNTISSLKTSSDSFNVDDTGEAEELPKRVDFVKIYRPIERPCTENVRLSPENGGLSKDCDVSAEEHKSVSETVREFSRGHHLISPSKLSPGGKGSHPPGAGRDRGAIAGSQGDIPSQRPQSFCYMKVTGSKTSDCLSAHLENKEDVTRSSPSTPRREGGGEDHNLRRWESELSGLQSSVAQRKAALGRLDANVEAAPLNKQAVSYSTQGPPTDGDEDRRSNSIRKMGKQVFNDRIRQWDSFSSGGQCPTPIVKHVERRRSNANSDVNNQQKNMTCWSEYQPSPLSHSPRQAPIIKFIIDKEPTQV